MNIAINGFGRIGKNFLRVLFNDKSALKTLTPTVINIGYGDIQHTAYSFKYDSILETFPGSVSMNGDELIVDDQRIKIIAEPDPRNIDWNAYNIDWVVEASGQFTSREKAQLHRDSGAKKVLVTAPATDEDITIIPGVNDSDYKPDHTIVSLGSCTTNALAPLMKVLTENITIKNVQFTTIHSYTNAQVLLDVEKKQYRNSRAAALNIIPTTTGASKVIEKVLPAVKGNILGCAVRVPVAKVSLLDVVATTDDSITSSAVNELLQAAAHGNLKNILDVTNDPVVSCDMNKNPHSVVIDSLLTQTQAGLIKVSGWYDNEWAYCERLKDFLLNS